MKCLPSVAVAPRYVPLVMKRLPAIAVTLAALALSRPAGAEEPFAIAWGLDLPIAVAGLAFGGAMQGLKEELVTERCAPSCDRTRVNALDDATSGRFSRDAALAGDVLVGVNLALPHLLGAVDAFESGRPASSLGRDTVLLAETLAVSVAVHQVVAFVARRPRPYVYAASLDPAFLHGANSYLSFYSGHTANSFAMATSYSAIFAARHPKSALTPAVVALTHGLAALEGYTRVMSGYHYPSDELVGALAGSTLGLVVPWLHRATPSAWSVAPVGPGDALGATLTWQER